MRVLALDLGTSLGYAVGDIHTGSILDIGTKVLATKEEISAAHRTRMDRRLDPRIPALHCFLEHLHWKHCVDFVVFEDVQFASTSVQTQLWSSFRAAVWLYAHELVGSSRIECVATNVLKSFAGYGAADKAAMANLLCRVDKRFSKTIKGVSFGEKILDDNAVDAAHILRWAAATLKNSK